MYHGLERKILIIMLAGLAALFVYFAFTWEGFYGGADNIAHYRISRYAFNYPHLFLDHWGKPLFTLLSSPFSQFGFTGIKVFNVLTGILAGLFTYLTAKKLGLKNSLLVLIFTFFAPVYFVVLPTALTEPLFSLVLILSVYLFFNQQYIFSAVVISFLPFARTEGIIILPLFFLALLYNRRFLAIFFLFTGFVLYSTIGLFYYGDFLWLIHQNPYTGAKEIYGSGELLHFIKATRHITGIPIAILLFIGTCFLIVEYIGQSIKTERKKSLLFLLLVAVPFFLYLAAHSYLWWKGSGGSLGLIRVIAGIIPLASLLALKGFNSFTGILRFSRVLKGFFALGLVVLIAWYPLNKYRNFELNQDERLITEAAGWLKNSGYYSGKIFYYHLYFIHHLGLDPYNTNICFEKVPDINVPSRNMPEGSIIQWDPHFGLNEGKLPLERLLNDPGLKLLKVFAPERPFKTWKGDDYKVYLFIRLTEKY